jgi:hypothetical protein
MGSVIGSVPCNWQANYSSIPHSKISTPQPQLGTPHPHLSTPHPPLASPPPQLLRLTLNSYAHLYRYAQHSNINSSYNNHLSYSRSTVHKLVYASPLSKLSLRLAVPLKVGEKNCIVVWNWTKKVFLFFKFSLDSCLSEVHCVCDNCFLDTHDPGYHRTKHKTILPIYIRI